VNRAIFLDGVPENLEAASMDSLEWLEFLRILIKTGRPRNPLWDDASERLENAIRTLKRFLPEDVEIQTTVTMEPEQELDLFVEVP